MAGTDITISAEQLDRMQKMTRARERARIADRIEELAASARGDSVSDGILYAFAEELRTEGVKIVHRVAEAMTDAEDVSGDDKLKGEIDALNGGVPVIAHDPSSGLDDDALPPVRHIDDEEMAMSMVRNRGVRGIAQGMRD